MKYPTPTAQALFETVAQHLFKQGHRAMAGEHDGATCVYLAPNGDMCAVGVCIPPEARSEQFDKDALSVKGVIDRLKAMEMIDLSEHRDILSELQDIHDHWDETEEHLRSQLVNFRADWSITTAFLADLHIETAP
jgi:hypothetical protein